jgi:hypothetical protein
LRDVVANPVDVLNLPFKHYLWVGKVLLESDFAGIHFWKPLGEADIDTEDDRNPYRLTFSVSLPHLPNLFVVPLKIQFPYPLTPAAVNFVTEESTKFLNRARVTLGVSSAANRFALAHSQNSAEKAEISRKSGLYKGQRHAILCLGLLSDRSINKVRRN